MGNVGTNHWCWLEEGVIMVKSLYDYIERIAHVIPEALNTWRAQSPDGFVHVSENLLGASIVHLEQQANNFQASGEDNITTAAIGFLTRYGIQATSQTNSRGHVDIFIQHGLRRTLVICGEAKIWRGTAYHMSGLTQVLGYCTGRLPFCFVLVYVKTGAIQTHVNTLRSELDARLPNSQQGPCLDHHSLNWALVTNHVHSSSNLVTVLHAGVNLVLKAP